MKDKMIALVAFLQGETAFTGVFGAGGACRLYPVVAPEGAQHPFAIYSLSSDTLTSDGRGYSGLLSFYFGENNYTELIEAVDAAVELLDGSPSYDAAEVETGYSEKYTTNVANINFNIL